MCAELTAIARRYTSAVASYAATVTEIEELASSVVQITVAFQDDSFSFEPGQWVNFRFPDGVSRAYTIASAPQRTQAVQLCVRVGAGRGGKALTKLDAGANVTIEGPYGDFVLPENDDKPMVFLAGDTGIAPVRSIVLSMLANHDPRAICVLYEPDQRNILYAADFDPLARDGAIRHESGKIETLIARNRKQIQSATVMAAGFDPFIDRVGDALRENGIDTASLISETFGPMPLV
ncbi:MAG: phenol/toluene 2-monooxygenase [Thermoanaerobaculia bacterium]|jgi:ferredoxin-NADP reductase|nr:phenol/toluene 2-monooxygenase [Thermoanaerobaculia bacterium]